MSDNGLGYVPGRRSERLSSRSRRVKPMRLFAGGAARMRGMRPGVVRAHVSGAAYGL